jgi:hypothetical protein
MKPSEHYIVSTLITQCNLKYVLSVEKQQIILKIFLKIPKILKILNPVTRCSSKTFQIPKSVRNMVS